jgi:peptidyl-tRNA hydrolase
MAEPATEQGPQVLDLAEFVLSEFTAEEIPKLRQVIGLAADAVASLVQDGPAAAMNRFNGLRA